MYRTQAQIEQYRKGTALVQVQDQDGRPCARAQISVEQETHQFQFGCLLSNLSEWSGNDRERYHRRVTEVFNIVRDADERPCGGAQELTIDLSKSNERIHLAELQRRLDGFQVPTVPGNRATPKVDVFASGTTIGMGTHPGDSRLLGDNEQTAARCVAQFYTLCFSHPMVRGVFWIGMSDREEGVGSSGLLRQDLAPKRAHKALQKLIHVIWHTRERGETDARGQFRFHGFFGTYRVVVARRAAPSAITRLRLWDGHPQEATIMHVAREEPHSYGARLR